VLLACADVALWLTGVVSSFPGGGSSLGGLLFGKKASFSWEFMFTKARYKTPDMSTQRDILSRVAELVDEGAIRSTLTKDGGTLTAEALAEAHRVQASGGMIGKMAFRL
jgi:NADPH:quinone reductase